MLENFMTKWKNFAEKISGVLLIMNSLFLINLFLFSNFVFMMYASILRDCHGQNFGINNLFLPPDIELGGLFILLPIIIIMLIFIYIILPLNLLYLPKYMQLFRGNHLPKIFQYIKSFFEEAPFLGKATIIFFAIFSLILCSSFLVLSFITIFVVGDWGRVLFPFLYIFSPVKGGV